MLPPALTGSGASALEIARTGADETVVVIAAPLTGPVSFELMLYVPFVISVPLAIGEPTVTTSCTEPDPPAASAPMFQVTTPPASAPPPVADAKVVFAGTVSVTTTPVALAFPVLEYDSV